MTARFLARNSHNSIVSIEWKDMRHGGVRVCDMQLRLRGRVMQTLTQTHIGMGRNVTGY